MKETFITSLADQAGAFLGAVRAITQAGANIHRVSYNKAVDTHMLFLDVEGEEAQLKAVEEALTRQGYLADGRSDARVILLSFTLPDHPGALLPVLEVIEDFHFNISYISSQGDGSGVQHFKMGLFTRDMRAMRAFIARASALCEVQVLDYDQSEKVMDNTVFYLSFVKELAQRHHMTREQRMKLMSDANLIMQYLEERDAPAHKTFEYIAQFSEQIWAARGPHFLPRITQRELPGCRLTVIEPPTGSNMTLLDFGSEILAVDSGFACYDKEMRAVVTGVIPDFFHRPHTLLLTHADIDHCGLMDWFDRVLMTGDALADFCHEQEGLPCWRETSVIHAPYCRISKLLSGYRRPDLTHLQPVGRGRVTSEPLEETGTFTVAGHVFRVLEGAGGHVRGEACYLCDDLALAFPGDIYVNAAGFTQAQSRFNQLAPYLMTSVNMNSPMASAERKAFVALVGRKYHILSGHGAPIWGEE